MDQDKTTVMGGYGSAQAGGSADATRIVSNPGNATPDATQASAEPTRVMGYGDTPRDPFDYAPQDPYDNAAPDPYDNAAPDPYDNAAAGAYNNLPQNPIPQPQQTTYMPRTAQAQPRYESRDPYARQPYREYPKSIPQYGEDEAPSRSSSVIKKILIVLAIFFALSIVFAIVSGMLNKRGSSTADTTAEQTESASSSTVDLSDIPGQYWSNAKKLLKSRGADLSNAVILTDDGSTPVVDANWVVTSAYYNADGNLEVQLTRKDGSSGNASGDQGTTDSSSSNTLEDLSNKAQELGDKAQELGDTAQNLGDTAQNLGDMATDAWNALQNGISGAQGN